MQMADELHQSRTRAIKLKLIIVKRYSIVINHRLSNNFY